MKKFRKRLLIALQKKDLKFFRKSIAGLKNCSIFAAAYRASKFTHTHILK